MAIRRARAVNTYAYDGDLFDNIMGQGNFPSKWWSALTVHERERRFFSEFRMPEAAFEDLLLLVGPSIRVKNSTNPNYRLYCSTLYSQSNSNVIPAKHPVGDNKEATQEAGCKK